VDGVVPPALAALSRDVDAAAGGVEGAFPEPEVELHPEKELKMASSGVPALHVQLCKHMKIM
jgi:hypothetical protein